MDLIQELFDLINDMYTKICVIEDAIEEKKFKVEWKYCNKDNFQTPFIESKKIEFNTPKFLHNTLKKYIETFINEDDPTFCLIPECFITYKVDSDSRLVRIESQTIEEPNPANPPIPPTIAVTFDIANIVTASVSSVDIIGVNNPANQKNFLREYINGLFSIVKSLVEFAFMTRYALKDQNGLYIQLGGQPVDPKGDLVPINTLRLSVPQDFVDCINNQYFLLLQQIVIAVPLIDAPVYFQTIFADFIRPLLCYEKTETSQPNCVPVFYGEIREKYKYVPQLHLVFEMVPKPANPKDLRKTEMVIPFPKIPDDLGQFNPNVFANATRTIGDIYAQARWKNFSPTDETTAAFFDTEENAKKFFDTYIFPYCLLEPVESDPDPVTGVKTRITTTKVTNKQKRLIDGRIFRVTRLVYLTFDEFGYSEKCTEWSLVS